MTDATTAQPEEAPYKGTSSVRLLRDRNRTHGAFKDNAHISQAFKKIAQASPGWNKMSETQRECFDQCCLKWSRILSGKADERQHWEDLVGYPQLIVDEFA